MAALTSKPPSTPVERFNSEIGANTQVPGNSLSEDASEPFVSFPCSCAAIVSIHQVIMPGQVGVTQCDNCGISWAVHCPSLVIKATKDLPEELQAVWGELSR